MSVSSEALDLMTLLTLMYSICENITIVDLVALPSAEWAHLVASKSPGSHFLIKVSDELIILKSYWIFAFNINCQANCHLTHQALDEVIDIWGGLFVLLYFFKRKSEKALYIITSCFQPTN